MFSSARSAVIVVLLAVPMVSAASDTAQFDAAATIKQMAALSSAISHVQEISRISEGMAFWQSVAIFGTANDWTFLYSSGGTEQLP